MHDTNTNTTLFESNAIIFYLISTYDQAESISHTSFPEMYHLQQWSYFQASGQGPYFGQAAWYVPVGNFPYPTPSDSDPLMLSSQVSSIPPGTCAIRLRAIRQRAQPGRWRP